MKEGIEDSLSEGLLIVHEHKGRSDLDIKVENDPSDREVRGGEKQSLWIGDKKVGMICAVEHVDESIHPPCGAINYTVDPLAT